MKAKITLKSLLLLCALIVGGVNSVWAEEVYSLTPDQTSTSRNETSYITSLTEFTYNNIKWEMNQWNPKTLQIKTNQNSADAEFRFYNTSAFPRRITQVVISFSALAVSDASKLMFLGGTSKVTATTGGTAGTWNSTDKTLTWTPGATENYTYFAFYQNGKAASGTNNLASSDAIVVKYESSGSTNLTASDLALTGAPLAMTFDLYNNSAAQTINYTTSSTGAVTIAANDYATFTIDETTKTITVTPTAVTPSPQTITVNQTADDTYAAGSATFTISIDDSTPIPTHTVTLGDDSSTLTEESAGAGVTLPTRDALNGYDFAGWSETNVSAETTNAPTIIPAGAYTPTADITLYPVYTKTVGGGGTTHETANVTISDYATANNWVSGSSSGPQYTEVVLNSDVKATTTGTGNNGKYYSDWRFYQSGNGNVTIRTTSGELTSVTFTYSVSNTGTLNYNSSAISSGTAVEVSGTSAEFTVGNSGSATNGQVRITAISVNYDVTGGGTIYYWSAPVAAAVETPAIVVADNPFLFSTTATITCATDGAAIKYSYDGETWNDYTEALTLTETKTIYAKAVKGNDESTVAQVTATKNLAEPTVTVSGDLALDLDGETSVGAGTLTATVAYETAAIEGATVTWSSSNTDIAEINETTGAVTIKAIGEVTFTATYAGNSDYAEATGTKTVIVSDSQAPGSEEHPYTVAEARAAIDANSGVTGVYTKGIVCTAGTVNDAGQISYYISDDGTETNSLLAYNGKGINGDSFTSDDDIQVGDVVVVYGNIKKYYNIYEFDQNNQQVSLVRKPSFSPEAGTYTTVQNVTLSTITEDATIYYTTDGTEPTTGSTVYSEAIAVNANMTIKAIAVKDNLSSIVATADYVINRMPTLIVEATDKIVNVDVEGTITNHEQQTIKVNFANFTTAPTTSTVFAEYCDENGDALVTSGYDWITSITCNWVSNGYFTMACSFAENTESTPRTAYVKVYAVNDNVNVYSDLITITQAAPVTTYSLVTSSEQLVSGKHYIIVGKSTNKTMAMGAQKSNNREAVEVTETDNTISETDGVCEFVICGPDAKGRYAIYDATGYLYAASSSANQLKTQTVNDIDGKWSISFANNTTAIDAIDSSNRSVMQFNTSSSIFSCYASQSQSPVYLYAKDGDETLTVDVNFAASGYATYCSPFALDLTPTEDYAAWAVTGTSGSTVTFSKISGPVPADTPFILYGENYSGQTATLSVVTGATTAVTGNMLKGTLVPTPITTVKESYTNFGLSGGNFVKIKNGTLPANKAYLPILTANVPAGTNARLNIVFNDETTGILELKNSGIEGLESCYDLQGRRVEKPMKGLYIVNGKKVVIK